MNKKPLPHQQPSHPSTTTCSHPPTQQLMDISKINRLTMQKQILYYTPSDLFTKPQGKIFHPLDWSIQDFQIGRHLGKGKYGHVYLARHRVTKVLVAIKIITKKQIVKNDIIFQLRREIEIHSHLRHPNILGMQGWFFDQKRICIVLDYAPYGEIYKILQTEGKFSEQRTALYIYQMIQALKYIHSHRIIHRDIKPQNILLSIDDQIKLTDFGWSVHVSDPTKKRKTYCGTPDYICPQIALQRDYDYRLDLWCLGVLTYEFAAGYAPFTSDSIDRRDMFRRIREVNFEFPKHFSKELRGFVGGLLRVKAEERISLEQAEGHQWLQRCYFDVVKRRKQQEERDRISPGEKDIQI